MVDSMEKNSVTEELHFDPFSLRMQEYSPSAMVPLAMVPSEIVPLEEAVEALINGLVAPFLPRRGNSNAPTPEQQELVAKQMYAVVVLYNYYHRKLFPKLEFLNFKSFCKISCISKPSLLKYMKAIYQGDVRSGELDVHLSLTERMILYACNVSSALDASKDAPGMEGWPISNVAVFLVDPSKEYCLLRSNGGTEAIMSIIEKDLVTPLENVFCATKTKNMLGSKINESHSLQDTINSVDHILLETALSTVYNEMGISRSNLSILGCHLSYSMSHIKSCSRLYIMSYRDPIDSQISVKEVMQSLQGPLVKINSGGAPEVTAVIRYHSLLPYTDILSDFLLRESFHCTLQPNFKPKADVHKKGSERILVNDYDRTHEKMNLCCSKSSTLNETISKNKEKPLVVDLFALSQKAAINSLAKKVLPTINGEAEEGDLSSLKQNLDIVISKKRKIESLLDGTSEAAHHFKADDSATEHNLKSSIRDEVTNLSNAFSRNSADDMENGLNQVGESTDEMLNCHDPLLLSKNVDLMSVLQKFKKKRDELCQQQRLLEDNISHCEMGILTVISGNKASASKIESILNTCEFLSSSEMKKDTILFSEAQCHPQTIGRKRLCEAVLCLQNPCQELDEIFCTNNWILPKYYVFPSVDGKFQALVSVRGMDFESECNGDWKSSPKEARESSAAHMLSKLRNMAIGTQHSA